MKRRAAQLLAVVAIGALVFLLARRDPKTIVSFRAGRDSLGPYHHVEYADGTWERFTFLRPLEPRIGETRTQYLRREANRK